MVIEYKIKFSGDTVTVTQSVEPVAGKGNDLGGDGLTEKADDTGGDGLTEKADDAGGDGLTEKADDGGSAGPGRGRVIAVVLGPLVLGNAGPARANGSIAKKRAKPATKAEIKKRLTEQAAKAKALKGSTKK